MSLAGVESKLFCNGVQYAGLVSVSVLTLYACDKWKYRKIVPYTIAIFGAIFLAAESNLVDRFAPRSLLQVQLITGISTLFATILVTAFRLLRQKRR
jgi:hypothetical protein